MPRKCSHPLLIASIILTSQPMIAQQATDSQQVQGQAAVHAVLRQVVLITNNPTPKTGKDLAVDGHWSIGKETPPACLQTAANGDQPCLQVIYMVPDADVSCKWVVLLNQNGSSGSILEQNDDATRYFLYNLPSDIAKSLVLTRKTPIYPPIAIAAHVQGDVKLQIFVRPDGKFAGKILSGPAMLTGSAADAMKDWSFRPLRIGGRAVSFQTDVTFHFATSGPPFGNISSVP